MTRQESMYAQYVKYQEAYENYKRASKKETNRLLFLGAFPSLVLALLLAAQQTMILVLLGFIFGAIFCILFALVGAKWFKINPIIFDESEAWEEALTSYMEDCGVNLGSIKYPYRHTDDYSSVEDWSGSVTLYSAKAEVNGVSTPVKVLAESGKIVVSTPDAELTPIS